jgi:hypothetical protein
VYYYPRRCRAVGLRWSRVRRTCHGPCFVLATLGHVPRQLLRGRRCRTSSTRQRASHPRAYGARPIPRADARLRAMSCRVLVLEDSDSHAARQALRLLPRATVIGHANGHRTRYEDPALLTEVAGQLPRQRPMRCRYRDLDSLSPVGRPRPPPQEVRRNRWHENSKAVFPPTNPAHVPASSPRCRAVPRALKVARAQSAVDCSCQALSARASCGASAPGQPRSGFRGVAQSATSSIFDRLPTTSFQQQHSRPFGPSILVTPRRDSSKSCGSRSCPPTCPPYSRTKAEAFGVGGSRGLPGTVLRTGSRATPSRRPAAASSHARNPTLPISRSALGCQ